ncbi:phosphomannomutase [[Mycoplasma] mobile]|uniref:Phosphomannomutase n=1 Tax=Mycoplasma mobile (strain ATCC 43663 / 163K / NCTC 11711) TaxID=267748 RepID=Q6KHC0_MYCM1|nr:phosphomannomutase [[Mycoplasma] mobile]AAT28010.1 phosphomannomutase [Mycoplasma mobile 163K]
MNKLEIFQEWKKYFIGDKFYTNKLNEIANIEEDETFFHSFLIDDRKIKGRIDVGYNSFNPITIKLISNSFAEFLRESKIDKGLKAKILISHDGSEELRTFIEIMNQVFLENDLDVYLFEENKGKPLSLIQNSLNNIKVSLCFYFSRPNKNYRNYWLQIFNANSEFLENSILFLITNNINKQIPLVNSIATKKSFYLLSKKIETEYIDSLLKIQINSSNDKKLKVLIANSSKIAYDLMQDISSLMNIEFILSKKVSYLNSDFFTKAKNTKFLRYLNKFILQAKKSKLDVILVPSFNANQIDVIIRNNNDYWLLNHEQIAILLLEYIFANKSENFIAENNFVVTTKNSSEIIERICKKHNVALYEDTNFFQNMKNYEKKLLLYFDEEGRFLLNSSISTSSDIFQLQVLLLEVLNYHKSQTRDLNVVLTNFVSKYSKKVLFEKTLQMSKIVLVESLKKISIYHVLGDLKIKNIEYFKNFNDSIREKQFIAKIHFEEGSSILFTYYSYTNIVSIFIVTENEYREELTNKKINKNIKIFNDLKRKFLI